MTSHETPVHASGRVLLPTSRLEFGLANGPADLNWMTGSGVPWKYRYQYLSGGVNTNQGWETWNTPSGAFAAYFMSASGAAGYIPVFSYYEICQSLPAGCGGDQQAAGYNNLNNATTMNAYYANFKILMQQAHTFGQLVVVQVEPDFWGFMEQKAAGGNASTVSASVASSGFADVSGIPNTLQGFAEALLHLRDLYASNVALGIHSSMWASGVDVASSTDSTLNVITAADATAAFLNSAGMVSNPYSSTWDVVFNDVDDHDAGWWEAQGADNQYFTHWWDPTNTTFPNFARYLSWVAELHLKTSRQQIVWQVPEGNQYFLTENNTCGHYQDNIAPYFISHTQSLVNAGLVAVLFGAGNACQTTNADSQGDGITNNSGGPTSDPLGGCNACNTHTSVSSDDDGGYLRVFVGQYYANIWVNSRFPVAQSPAKSPGNRAANPSTSATPVPRIVRRQHDGLGPANDVRPGLSGLPALHALPLLVSSLAAFMWVRPAAL
jgi:hypothetical protein